MVSPVSSLANMEMQLYGGLRTNPNAPSLYNNYCGTSAYNYGYNYMTPNYNTLPQYNNYGYNTGYASNTNFGQTIPQAYLNTDTQATVQNGTQQATQNQTIFQGLTQSETKALVDTYQKSLDPEQAFRGAVIGGALSTAITMNPRIIAHPVNTLKTFFSLGKSGDTNKMFQSIAKSDLWKNNSYIMEEAFSQMNRTEARSLSKLGLFRKQYSAQEYSKLKDIMQKAIDSSDVKEIAKATETLRSAQVNNGGLFSFFKGKNTPTAATGMANTTAIQDATNKLLKSSNMTYKQAFEVAGGKFGLLIGGIEFLGSIGKIKTAFEEDKKTGLKQLGQTTVKSVVGAFAWQGGEALGIWGASKLTPMIASKFGGKWATIAAVIARPLCGLFCNWLGRKAAKKVVGQDVADKIQARKAAETNEGQMEIVQTVLAQAQNGQKVDPQALQAIQKLYTMYA